MAALLAAGLAAAVYANGLRGPFVYDDEFEIVQNQSIRDLTNFGTVVRGALTRPLVNLSYAVDYRFWGLEPLGYHVTSLLLHTLNVLLLFWLVRRLAQDAGGDRGSPTLVAFAAASLLAVHPMMTEAVTYVSSRSELLSGVMCLSSLLCFRRAFLEGGRLWWIAAVGFFLLGLASKETAAMLPLLLLAYDGVLLPRHDEVRRLSFPRLHAALVLGVIAAGAVRLWLYLGVQVEGAAPFQYQNALTELHVIVRYISLLFYPASQSIVQPVDLIASVFDWRVATSAGVILLFTGIAVLARRRDPLVTFGLIWFFLLLVPSASLILLASFGQPMAEHRVYMASGGFFMAVTAFAVRMLPADLRWGARLASAAAGFFVVLSILGTLTVARNRVWQEPVRLWEDAARKAPATWMAVYGLAAAYGAIGDDVAAGAAFERAIALNPGRVLAYVDLARSLAEQGRNESARLVLREAVRRVPGEAAARLLLAQIEERAFSNVAEAARLCREALAIEPGNTEASACLGRIEP